MTTTTTMITIVSVMLVINIGLAMMQSGITEVNPEGVKFFDTANSPYSHYVEDGKLVVDASLLPEDEAVSGDTSGNVFTDTYKNIKSWMQKKLAPLNFVGNVLSQPYGFLKDVNLPEPVALGFGALWYLMAVLVIVSWWSGR